MFISAPYFFALVATVFSFSSYSASSDTVCQQHECVAVVDAGSTGSRLHIYAFDRDETATPVNIKELWSKKIKPGLATMDTNQTAVNTYLTTLFAEAPAENIPVHFYATAGMRLLSQSKQKQLYDLMQNWFANQNQWQLKSSKTITGKEEGLYGWLAINYQLGTFTAHNKAIGVMDMGGASVQIIVPVEKEEGLNPSDIQELDLYGQHLKLFIHSFLGLGQTEVAHQYLDTSSCFANDYELPSGLSALGDAFNCAKEVTQLLNNVHQVNQTIQPAITANPVNNWFVMGGMAELARSIPFQFENNQFTNAALIEQANIQVCHQQWTTLTSQYPNNEYLYGYCFLPSYYFALMVEGYGIQPQQPINYLSANQGDWTLGVVLLKAGETKNNRTTKTI